ncbi:MAG: DUF2807 domain-containing protein [Treponema sp.]|jgi:hypothetical protein|nr:DUF2807 domain-containing protein [Treponema sp.]
MKRNSAIPAIIITAALSLFMSGCVIINLSGSLSVSPKGEKETYMIRTGDFNGIIVESACVINYYSAPSDSVTLSIQPNLREYFMAEVVENNLVIYTTRNINFNLKNSPELTVSVPVLNRIAVKGACDFKAHDKIKTDSLIFSLMGTGSGTAELGVENLSASISGAGKLDLSGEAAAADFVLSGTGELNALPLQVQDANVSLSGTGTIRVNSSENLRINANGTGAVVYKGSPRLELNKNGLVNVMQVN